MTTSSSYETITKEQLELEKLRQELISLKRPWWKDYKVLGAIIAFLTSALFNIIQFENSEEASARANRELSLKSAQWESNKIQLEQQIQQLTKNNDFINGRREEVAFQLQQVKKDIITWENAEFKNNMELMSIEAELDMQKNLASPDKTQPLIDATLGRIELHKRMMSNNKEKLTAAKQRESDLENQLRALACS
jgi:hypothetical protein